MNNNNLNHSISLKSLLKKLFMNRKFLNAIFYVCFSAMAVLILAPVLFIVFTSLKTPRDFYGGNAFNLPEKIYLGNLFDAFIRLKGYMLNGVLICIIKVPLGILIEASAAFALTRLKIHFPRVIFILFLIGMMIPMQITLVPLNIGFKIFKLANTYLGLILVYLGFGIPFGILVLRGFFRTVPKELDESATIDGCSRFQLFFKIIIPLSKPALVTLLILDFLGTWNEFLLVSVLVTSDKMRTVPAGLLNFIGEDAGVNYGLLAAGGLVSIIPVLIIYIIFQRYFVEGMAGAVKG